MTSRCRTQHSSLSTSSSSETKSMARPKSKSKGGDFHVTALFRASVGTKDLKHAPYFLASTSLMPNLEKEKVDSELADNKPIPRPKRRRKQHISSDSAHSKSASQQNRRSMLFSDSEESPQRATKRRKVEKSDSVFQTLPNGRRVLCQKNKKSLFHNTIADEAKPTSEPIPTPSESEATHETPQLQTRSEASSESTTRQAKLKRRKARWSRKRRAVRAKDDDGFNVHEYGLLPVALRTRTSRKLREKYTKKIQKEYHALEKDTLVKAGKCFDIVCLD